MRICIVSASSCYRGSDGKMLIPSDELKSLNQWFNIFDDVTLFRPLHCNRNQVHDWVPVPANVKIVEICNADDGLRKKYSSIKSVASKLQGYDWIYYRLPNYESLFFWMNQPAKIPYFVELHGDMETAVMASHSSVFKFIWSKIMLLAFRRMASRAKFALTIGPALRDKYVKTKIPVYVTTNHLLKEEDYPMALNIRPIGDCLNILFVGHIHNRKGLTYLFEALSMLNAEKTDFILRIAGQGELKPFLEQYALEHGFSDKVQFLGQIKHGKDLFDLYRQADLFILPSIAAEGVPRVTHEAMAFGCPVIATDIGSVRWQLEVEAGIVIPPKNSKAIFDAIKQLVNDKALRDRIIYNGYNKSKSLSLEQQGAGIKDFVVSTMDSME